MVSLAHHATIQSIAGSGGTDIDGWMANWGVRLAFSADTEKAAATASLGAAAAATSAAEAGGEWPPAQAALQDFIAKLNALIAAAEAQQKGTLIPVMRNVVTTLSNDLAAVSAAAAPPPPPPPMAPPPAEPRYADAYVADDSGGFTEIPGGVPYEPQGGDQYAAYAAEPAAAPAAGYAPPPAPAPHPEPGSAGEAAAAARVYGQPGYRGVAGGRTNIGAYDPGELRGNRPGQMNPAFRMHYHHHPVMHSVATAYGQQNFIDWLGNWGITPSSMGSLDAPNEKAQAEAAFEQAAQLCAQINVQGKAPGGTRDALDELIAQLRALSYVANVQRKVGLLMPFENLADTLNTEVRGRHHFRF